MLRAEFSTYSLFTPRDRVYRRQDEERFNIFLGCYGNSDVIQQFNSQFSKLSRNSVLHISKEIRCLFYVVRFMRGKLFTLSWFFFFLSFLFLTFLLSIFYINVLFHYKICKYYLDISPLALYCLKWQTKPTSFQC